MDMSCPEGGSVNDGISDSLCSLTYIGIEDPVRGIAERGRGTLMEKVDVHSTHRDTSVHPKNRWLMGMVWRDALFVDTSLPFCLRSAPKIFTAVADAVEWIARQEGVAVHNSLPPGARRTGVQGVWNGSSEVTLDIRVAGYASGSSVVVAEPNGKVVTN